MAQSAPAAPMAAGPAASGLQKMINDSRMDAQKYNIYAHAIKAALATGNFAEARQAQQAMELTRSRRAAMMQQLAATELTEQQAQMLGIRRDYIPDDLAPIPAGSLLEGDRPVWFGRAVPLPMPIEAQALDDDAKRMMLEWYSNDPNQLCRLRWGPEVTASAG
jgi:hypothetical protein